MKETWEQIPGYEGIYEVSNLGSVRSSENKITRSELHGTRIWKQRILKQKTDKNGYKRVDLWNNNQGKSWLVHRLVMLAFAGEDEEKRYVNHKDGNPSNNCLTNLEWCDHRENLMHAYKNELNKSPDPVILLSLETGEMHYFYSKAEASSFLGMNKGYISNLLKRGKSKADGYRIFTTFKG